MSSKASVTVTRTMPKGRPLNKALSRVKEQIARSPAVFDPLSGAASLGFSKGSWTHACHHQK